MVFLQKQNKNKTVGYMKILFEFLITIHIFLQIHDNEKFYDLYTTCSANENVSVPMMRWTVKKKMLFFQILNYSAF